MYKLKRSNKWPWEFVLSYDDTELMRSNPVTYTTHDTDAQAQEKNHPETKAQAERLALLVEAGNKAKEFELDARILKMLKAILLMAAGTGYMLLAGFVSAPQAGICAMLAFIYAYMGFKELA